MKRIVSASRKLNCGKWAQIVSVLSAAMTMALVSWTPAQAFTTLHNFDGADGESPGGLVQATDGNFYSGDGAFLKITQYGTVTTLGSSGGTGRGPLVQAIDGNFYGTTYNGGVAGWGSVFRITPGGKLTTLYSFCPTGQYPCRSESTDGASPSPLVQGIDGNFYGTTFIGGVNGQGTVFRITPGGKLTTLYSFCPTGGPCADGSPTAGLIQVPDGSFYGTTTGDGYDGGDSWGTVFRITPGGKLTTLHTFDGGTDGALPYGGLFRASDGNLYGTTFGVSQVSGNNFGTVFRIDSTGSLTTLYSFSGGADGAAPLVGLVQATDGNFYGTTSEGGGDNDGGTVFKMTPSGTLTTLHRFCLQSACPDGVGLDFGLVQATNENVYGTTAAGGANGDGTFFRVSLGVSPFIRTLPAMGKAGIQVTISGTDLAGATSVTFNGIPAAFTVVRPYEIQTTVPAGATTGTVKVVTPSGTLSSNVRFRCCRRFDRLQRRPLILLVLLVSEHSW
jgi:uncharacterized repeat protein (TIGR03803 family)